MKPPLHTWLLRLLLLQGQMLPARVVELGGQLLDSSQSHITATCASSARSTRDEACPNLLGRTALKPPLHTWLLQPLLLQRQRLERSLAHTYFCGVSPTSMQRHLCERRQLCSTFVSLASIGAIHVTQGSTDASRVAQAQATRRQDLNGPKYLPASAAASAELQRTRSSSCRVLTFADGMHLEADIFEHTEKRK